LDLIQEVAEPRRTREALAFSLEIDFCPRAARRERGLTDVFIIFTLFRALWVLSNAGWQAHRRIYANSNEDFDGQSHINDQLPDGVIEWLRPDRMITPFAE